MIARRGWVYPLLMTALVVAMPSAMSIAAEIAPARPGDVERPAGVVSLEHAVAAALARNPSVLAADALARAQEGGVRQAGVLPNPTLEGETEDLAGTGRFGSVSQPQTTVRLSQLVLLGGDREARLRAAIAERSLAAWDAAARRLDVGASTVQAFVDVQAAQEGLAIAENGVRLAETVVFAVTERVGAGFASPVEETKARVASAEARLQVETARQALAAACRRLAALWGGGSATVTGVTGAMRTPAAPPGLDILEPRLETNPDLARWTTEIERSQALVDVARARAVPDVTLSAGYRRFHDTGNDAIVVGASVPLPLFDRNRGGIDDATSRLEAARREAQAVRTRLQAALAEAYRALASASVEATLLDRDILPGAETAYDAAQEGYRGGRFGMLDVLDSQRTLFGARQRRVQALAAFHRAAAEIDRLTGRGQPEGLEGESR